MLKLRGNSGAGCIYLVFLFCLYLIIGLFTYRVVEGSVITPMSDGQVIMNSYSYQFGAVYDRNYKMIVSGYGKGTKWSSPNTEKAFNKIMGTDITSSLNSRITICGNCPWLFGTEDNRFSLFYLAHPGALRKGGSVRLTIDKGLQEYVHTLVREKGYENAYIVISNYKTGELLAVYGNALEDEMHPGSTIKPILAAAALSVNKKYGEHIYDCTSDNHTFKTDDGPFHIHCAGNVLHGKMNMEDALAYSCNGYFISLLQACNRERILMELQKWGFDSSISFSQFMYWDHRFLGESEKGIDYLLAAIGQANASITPAGLNFCTNALLNRGVLQEPIWFTDKQESHNSEWIKVNSSLTQRRLCESEVADRVVHMMYEVTERGTGTSFYMPGFAAKTGTAQKADENGEMSDLYTVWTTGGLTNDETPYSITVCLDNVKNDISSADAGKLAQETLIYLIEGGK